MGIPTRAARQKTMQESSVLSTFPLSGGRTPGGGKVTGRRLPLENSRPVSYLESVGRSAGTERACSGPVGSKKRYKLSSIKGNLNPLGKRVSITPEWRPWKSLTRKRYLRDARTSARGSKNALSIKFTSKKRNCETTKEGRKRKRRNGPLQWQEGRGEWEYPEP